MLCYLSINLVKRIIINHGIDFCSFLGYIYHNLNKLITKFIKILRKGEYK